MKIVCPKCAREVALADVNIQTNVLLCRACNEMFPLADDLPEGSEVPDDFSLDNPPAGAWYEQGMDGDSAGASCRGIGGLLFALVFALGFGGFPLAIMLGVVKTQGGDQPPFWFFAIFLLVGGGATIVFLLKLLGRTTITVSATGGDVFTGIGPFGWRKAFLTEEIERVGTEQCGTTNGKPMYRLALYKVDGTKIGFGMMLSAARQEYLRCAAITLLARHKE